MKTKLLALGISMTSLFGPAVFGEVEDAYPEVVVLDEFEVTPPEVKLLNDQKLEPININTLIEDRIDALEDVSGFEIDNNKIALNANAISEIATATVARN